MTTTGANVARVTEFFPRDIAAHQLTVHVDQGLFRHLRCAAPGTFNQHFYITTWPGYLAITGDMGAFVFRRLDDMFTFFRSDSGRVNYGYWAEKLVATERHGGHEGYSSDLFVQVVEGRTKEWIEWREYTDDEATAFREAVADEVLSAAHDGYDRAVSTALSFRYADEADHPFAEIYENSLTEYSSYFAWCCHAIVWAIAAYDAIKASAPVTP